MANAFEKRKISKKLQELSTKINSRNPEYSFEDYGVTQEQGADRFLSEGLEGYKTRGFSISPKAPLTKVDMLMNALSKRWHGGANPLRSSNVRVFSMESNDPLVEADTNEALNTLEEDARAAIDEEEKQSGDRVKYTEAQQEAAIMAAAAANERQRVTELREQDARSSAGAIGASDVGGEMNVGTRSMESYDESDNRNSMIMSFTYNLKAARQDEFGEAFFPTVAISPDIANVTIVCDLLSVFEETKRNTDGSFDYQWNRKSLINALVYPDILNNDTSRNYPIYRDSDPKNKACFVSDTDIPPYNVVIEQTGHEVKTAPLAIDVEVDLLGISAPDYLLEKGHLDFTDQLDQSVKLGSVYMKTPGGEIIAFHNLDQIPEATFTYVIQGNSRVAQLNFNNRFMTIDSQTLKNDNSASTLQAVTGHYTAQCHIKLMGEVDLNIGNISLTAAPVKVFKLFDASNKLIPTDSGIGKTVADEINGSKIIGYDVISRRINLNHRERGQLLDVNKEQLMYSMPTLAPVSIVRPTSESDSSDGARLDKLIQTTYIRCSVAAVEALLRAEAIMKTVPTIKEPQLLYNNKTLGVARYLITPYYKSITLNVEHELNTLTSSGRMSDVQAVLINCIRELVYRAYLESNYKSAASQMQGENGHVKPLVILGTDPYIAAYLMVTGDLRTLGDEFDLKVVSTPNLKMRNKMIIVFGKGSKGSQDLSNPLHFGNMLWRPELTSILPITRNGQTSKEITVQPSFLHVVHCPVMMSIDVQGLPEGVTKQIPVFANVSGYITNKSVP